MASDIRPVTKRKKVGLAPGHSQLDWVKLVSTNQDISGVPEKRRISMAEVATHNTEDDAWMVLRGYIFNVTPYLHFHPGGVDELMRGAGRDATKIFDEIHAWVNYESMLRTSVVGMVDNSVPFNPPGGFKKPRPKSKGLSAGNAKPKARSLNTNVPSGFVECPIKGITVANHNCKVFDIELPSDLHVPAGHHVGLCAVINDVQVVRPYTPLPSSATNRLTFIIKVYDQGALSSHMHSLAVGDTIMVRNESSESLDVSQVTATNIIMVAGGTGIAPMLKILSICLLDESSTLSFSLLFANRSEQDVILKAELTDLHERFPSRFTVSYILSQPMEGFVPGANEYVGRVSRDVFAKAFSFEGPTKGLVCGPASFMGTASRNLQALGCSDIHVFRASAPQQQAPGGAASKGPSFTEKFSLDQLSKDPRKLMVIKGNVYDVTSFVDDHPGGGIIEDGVGKDATQLYEDAFHSRAADSLLEGMHIGSLS